MSRSRFGKLLLGAVALVLLVALSGAGQVPTAVLDRVSRATVYIQTDNGGGSGFIISEDGYVLTCAHVVSDATTVHAHLGDGRSARARVLQIAGEIDTAVLKVDLATPDYVALGSSDSLGYGDAVGAIGFPSRLFTVTTGTVSAFPRIGELSILQITAPVNPGNSGGPLVRYSGEIVGMVFASASASEYFRRYGFIPQAMNYAIPIDAIKSRFGLDSPNWRALVEAELVFEDDFSQPRAWSLRREEYVFTLISDDVVLGPSYHYVSYLQNQTIRSALPGTTAVQNFILEVTARSASATPDRVERWHLAFRLQDGNYYMLRIFTDGSLDLHCRQFGRWRTVLERMYSEHIAQDRKVNHVRLIVEETQFIVEINGIEVARTNDSTITGAGRVALGVNTGQDFPYAHAVFTDVRLYQLP